MWHKILAPKIDSVNPDFRIPTKSMEIENLISEMIALQDLPFNFVEGIGFRRLLQFVVPNYQLRGRHFLLHLFVINCILNW